MAPKKRRPSPLEEPPTASSSEDNQPPSTQPPPSAIRDDSSSEDDGAEYSSEDLPPPLKQPANKTPPQAVRDDSSSESGSGSGSGSDSDPESTPSPNPKIKPIASKPMKAQAQAQAHALSTPSTSTKKRGIENSNANGSDSKRAKKKITAIVGGADDTEKDVKLAGEDSKKQSQRVFSEEDELVILKGLAEFISKTGKDPSKEPIAFHTILKKSLHCDATSEQLKRKIRGLKNKFETSSSFSKPHDKKAFELYKKVWGKESKEGEENGKILKSPKKDDSVRNNGSSKKEMVTKKESGKGEVENTQNKDSSKKEMGTKEDGKSDVENSSVMLSEMDRFDVAMGLSGLNKDIAKKGSELIEESKRIELEKRWKEIQIAEMELFVKRVDLIKEQASLILEAYKKPSH